MLCFCFGDPIDVVEPVLITQEPHIAISMKPYSLDTDKAPQWPSVKRRLCKNSPGYKVEHLCVS